MILDSFSVILVDSTSHAMRVENTLHIAGIQTKLIPVPRHLSSDCGVCVRISSDQVKKAADILNLKKIEYQLIEDL